MVQLVVTLRVEWSGWQESEDMRERVRVVGRSSGDMVVGFMSSSSDDDGRELWRYLRQGETKRGGAQFKGAASTKGSRAKHQGSYVDSNSRLKIAD